MVASSVASVLAHAEALALLPAGALAVSVFVARWRTPGDRARSAIQHFAAGVVFSTVAVELLPDLVRTHAIREVVTGFAVGVGLLLAIRAWTAEPPPGADRTEPAAQRPPAGMLMAVAIDILLDGMLMGLGFSLGAKEGVMITGALVLELVSLGLAIGSSLRCASRRLAGVVTAGLSVCLVAGAGLGVVLLSRLSEHAMAAVLAFGCAALMFLATEELLVEAHETGETPFATAMFFAGFVLFLVAGMAG